jgi:hypothetical protein
MTCVDEDTLVQFVEGTLPAGEVSSVEAHLDTCDNCRLLLSEFARGGIVAKTEPVKESTLSAVVEISARAGEGKTSSLGPGTLLAGRYRVIRWLGSGGMGAVYEVEDQQLHERVALKLLRPELKNIPQLLERLQQEIIIGRRITHPNVCRLYDIGQSGETYFITMELVVGENLDVYLNRETPTPERTIEILLQVCSALSAAHQQGVVHRDLKPANLMVDARGKVVVMDFGLARDLHGDQSQSGLLIGSPAYWSPEQAQGTKATAQSDIYAVGIIACELFGIGRPSLVGGKDLREIPLRYRSIIQRCLKGRAADRFSSANELLHALRVATQVGRRRRQLAMIAAGLVAGVSITYAVLTYLLVAPSATVSERAASSTNRTETKPQPSERVGSMQAAATDSGSSERGAARTGDHRRPESSATIGGQVAAGHTAGGAHSVAGKRRRMAKPLVPTAGQARATDAGVTQATSAAHPAQTTTADRKASPASDDAAARREREAALEPAKRLLAQLELERRKREVLLLDVPTYAVALHQINRAFSDGNASRSAQLAETMSRLLDETKIDAAFVSKKLDRLNKLIASRKLERVMARNVKATFAQVHSRYFAGDYVSANRNLNRIWRIVRSPP